MWPVHVMWWPPMPLALTLFYVASALAVSVNVLLKKSDVRGAWGWIALAWTSPFVGPLLFFLFGINRVERRALKFDALDTPQGKTDIFVAEPECSAHIALLAKVGSRITESPLTAGNAIMPLENGDTAYPAMLEAIAGAKRSVALLAYIFRYDAVGRKFVEALIAAHRRGVNVRVLIDSVGSGYVWSPVLHHLKRGGVPVERFLHTWIPWRMPFLNMRNHRKLLIADGEIGFMGGMNISAQHARSENTRYPVEDVHFRVEGPVLRQMMDTFARDWTFATEETLEDPVWWPEPKPQGPCHARGVRSGPDADIYKIETILGAALTQAERHVRIVTPYFLPDARLQFAIAQAVLRGVTVDILIPEYSDFRMLDWAIRAHLRFFRHIPANFWLMPPPFQHTKLVTVDGEWSLIGSSNWDARSLRLNFEYDLECYDTGLTATLDRHIEQRRTRARKLTPEALKAPVPILLRDAMARLLLPYL